MKFRPKSILVGCVLLLPLFCLRDAFPNGSSVIGNAQVVLAEGIRVNLPVGYIQTQGRQILDGRTQAPILTLTPIDPSLARKAGVQDIQAQLGSLRGLETIPPSAPGAISRGLESSFWRVCSQTDPRRCYQIQALDPSSAKVGAVLGALH